MLIGTAIAAFGLMCFFVGVMFGGFDAIKWMHRSPEGGVSIANKTISNLRKQLEEARSESANAKHQSELTKGLAEVADEERNTMRQVLKEHTAHYEKTAVALNATIQEQRTLVAERDAKIEQYELSEQVQAKTIEDLKKKLGDTQQAVNFCFSAALEVVESDVLNLYRDKVS